MLFIGFNVVAHSQDLTGKVTRIVDSNTLEITTKEKEQITVKFKEIELPLKGQNHADEAEEYLSKKLFNKKVQVTLRGKDWLGNKLADISVGKKNIQKLLLEAGLAWVKERGDQKLKSIQAEAQSQNIGLWEETNPTPPWVYRRKQTMLVAKRR